MALWRDDGLLELQGRTEDIFTIAGQQMAGRLIDLVLTTVPGVRAALSFMDPRPGVLEGTHAFIEVESGANGAECVFKATALCQEELGYVFAAAQDPCDQPDPPDGKGRAFQDRLPGPCARAPLRP